MELFDSHCHLDFSPFDDDRAQVLARMAEACVTRALLVSVDFDHMDRLQACADSHAGFDFSLGLHPNHEVANEPSVSSMLALAKQYPEIVAIGETGLDYFHHRVDPELQKQRFRTHLEVAAQLQLPVIIHMRDADDDTLEILRAAKPASGVMHCFSSSWQVAEQALNLGMFISFSGNVTFKRNDALRAVAAQVPLEWILLETDSPYLAPVPMRGKRNEPSFVTHVADCIAEVRGMTTEALALATTDNAKRLFGVA